MQEKTLGGDRLGSGKKMKVELHAYDRSTHDLGYVWRSTMSAGTLVPFMCKLGLPGDTWDINLDADIKTHPSIGPLFGSYKVQLDTFVAPIRLYQAQLNNNALNIGRNMAAIKLPMMELTASGTDLEDLDDYNNAQINPSCLLAYLGVRGIGNVNTVDVSATRRFNALGVLTYWDTYKNYYANKQEEIGAVIHTPFIAGGTPTQVLTYISIGSPTVIPIAPSTTPINITDGWRLRADYITTPVDPTQVVFQTSLGNLTMQELCIPGTILDNGVDNITGLFDATRWIGTGNFLAIYSYTLQSAVQPTNRKPEVVTFPLTNLDDMRNAILQWATPANPFLLDANSPEPYKWLFEWASGVPSSILNSQEGLALKTYQSDLFNNWLNTESIDGAGGITEITSIDTSGGSFSIDTLNLSQKVYRMLNRIVVSGGSYDDWMDAVWGNERYKRCTTPMYMGGLSKELVFQEVVSNSAAQVEGTQPLGTLAGKGVMAGKHKGGNVVIKIDEPSIILGLISLTPRPDYSQGNAWEIHLETMDDLHKPPLDQIGFQELITEQLAWWDTTWDSSPGEWVTKSAGKQPAWINYMTDINKTYGNFAIGNGQAVGEMYMTLNRRYEIEGNTIKDLTTYIDPSKFNFIFAETALDAQNFWAQIGVDITCRRLMSAKLMPNL